MRLKSFLLPSLYQQSTRKVKTLTQHSLFHRKCIYKHVALTCQPWFICRLILSRRRVLLWGGLGRGEVLNLCIIEDKELYGMA